MSWGICYSPQKTWTDWNDLEELEIPGFRMIFEKFKFFRYINRSFCERFEQAEKLYINRTKVEISVWRRYTATSVKN